MLFLDHLPRYVRRLLSGEKLGEFARTLVYVAPLTVLIWVYAEREQIATDPKVSLSVDVRSATAAKLATIEKPADRQVIVEMQGPRGKLEALRQEFMTLNNGVVVLDIDASPGTVTRSIAQLLSDQAKFKAAGVKVTAAIPSDLTIRIDEIASRDFIVYANPAAADFEAPPVFDPATVHVTGPKAALDRIATTDAAGRPAVLAAISRAGTLGAQGAHDNVDVPLLRPELPAGEAGAALTLSPGNVRATYRIRQGEESYTIPAMPVFPVASTSFLDEYRADFEPVVANITVRGSPELIAALRKDTLPRKPNALLEFGRDDLPASTPRKRKLRFDLPDGLSVIGEDLKREVEFTLTPRPVG